MAAATVRAYEFNGAAGATQTSIDTVGGTAPNFGTSDAVAATGTIQIPTSTGTNYAWNKNWGFNVTVAGTTTLSNRRIAAATSFTAGTLMFFKDAATYTQGALVTASGSNGPAVPATYTTITTSNQVWSSTGVATSGTGLNGDYVAVAFGVDSTFAGGGGSLALPNINLVYDEA